VHDPMLITVEDPDLAESLRRALSHFHAEVVDGPDGHAVRLELIVGNPESRITKALSAVDAWLARTGTAAVRVHLGDGVYTLSTPG
jgi:hypothetical protein